MKKKANHLFVYGTLMGQLNSSQFRFVGRDTIGGKMFNLGAFPGIRLDEEGVIHGELYEVLDEAGIPPLDRYEGYNPNNLPHSLYTREVTTTAEYSTECYVYQYNRNRRDSDREIPSGDWRNH